MQPTVRPHITLSQLTTRIKYAVNGNPDLQNQWVTAEIVSYSSRGGHIYLDLAEKDRAGNFIAMMRGTIWAAVAQAMKRRYGGERLRAVIKAGSEILVLGSASYHPQYSLSLNIQDIDPDYRKDANQLQAQIIAALTAEGILHANKEVPMPEAPVRLAVISSPSAAGYGDFVNQLLNNPYRLRFQPTLFEATMQGANVSPTIRAALDAIEQRPGDFDCVIIIRGGGATSDLAGFDEIQLARAVALFPLPVIVGIGHERDNTVLDYIANTRVKTPTAAAEFLVARNASVLARVMDLCKTIGSYAAKMVEGERRQLDFYADKVPMLAKTRSEAARARLSELTTALPLLVQGRLDRARALLDTASRAIDSAGRRRLDNAGLQLDNYLATLRRDLQVLLSRETQRLQALSDKVALLSPANILARGYSITRLEGHALRSADDAPPGSVITTTLSSGTLTSIVKDL